MPRDDREADIGSVLIIKGVEGDTVLVSTANMNELLYVASKKLLCSTRIVYELLGRNLMGFSTTELVSLT